MTKYFGITYPKKFSSDKALKQWKLKHCTRNEHLFDEVASEDHYLSCDACGLVVYIAKIDTKYQKL